MNWDRKFWISLRIKGTFFQLKLTFAGGLPQHFAPLGQESLVFFSVVQTAEKEAIESHLVKQIGLFPKKQKIILMSKNWFLVPRELI